MINNSVEQENELLDKAFRASPCLMAISAIADGRYIKVNKCFEEATGFPAEEVVGRTSIELNIFDTLSRTRVAELLINQGTLKNIEASFRTKDGSIRIGLFSAELIEFNGQKCILSVANDVTELRNYEKEVSKLERMNLIGQIAASIGHEIRNPMTTVRGYLQLLGAKADYMAEKATFDLMISELDRANEIIAEFLSVAKMKQNKLKSKNLNEIISNLYPLIEADAFTQNKQICFIPGVIPDLEFYVKEISQLVLNLTRNGFEAMEERGCLNIRTFTEGKRVVLQIEDEGSGISPECLNKLGTPFFTTKDYGTGLGLATCYKIAENHNAKILINSSSSGTNIGVLFPIR
ncbi:diguanylate cyclase [Desulfosporosinus sp. HMP52]|uniref:two-component system sensor histidine kinase NtrB n=1 Tax=Desulfosporosinus sp. HMP52 TaxID=1487923 RepID=UPI00051FC1A8|nr:ATP-binding protein [Desulfosporosinus sp. HMP52]KGK82456.1 diguanylate cyclase [Desulfosporosinus sp. HMP52]